MTESVCTGLSLYACGVLLLSVNVQLKSMGDPRAHQHEKGSSSLEGWKGECRDKVSQPGALTSGVGWPPLSALTTGTVMWKSSVWGLFQLLMSVLSEPRVFELHWSPFGSGTRRHTKAASARGVVARCAYFLWADSSVTFTPALPSPAC